MSERTCKSMVGRKCKAFLVRVAKKGEFLLMPTLAPARAKLDSSLCVDILGATCVEEEENGKRLLLTSTLAAANLGSSLCVDILGAAGVEARWSWEG